MCVLSPFRQFLALFQRLLQSILELVAALVIDLIHSSLLLLFLLLLLLLLLLLFPTFPFCVSPPFLFLRVLNYLFVQPPAPGLLFCGHILSPLSFIAPTIPLETGPSL